MSWIAFVAKLKDGKHIGFVTTYINEFFDFPDDYSVNAIVEIIKDSYAFQDGTVVAHRDSGRKNMDKLFYTEKNLILTATLIVYRHKNIKHKNTTMGIIYSGSQLATPQTPTVVFQAKKEKLIIR